MILKPIYLEKNGGLGNALRIALENCSNDLIARMDSDDVSHPKRFEVQLEYFKEHPEVDIVGGNITEFIGDESNIIGQRQVPCTDAAIKKYMGSRCAFNHMTVMYKKNMVLTAGGYQDWFWNEDYFLWIRMMLTGAKFANLPYDLVNARVGNEMSARRGGMKYFKSEVKLQKYMLDHRIIGIPQYLYNVAIRFGGEVIAPTSIRTKLFRLTRKKLNNKSLASAAEFNRKKATGKNKVDYPAFSVAMSVYKNDNPKWFDRALESITNQTIVPDEIVLVVDGPVPEGIYKVIEKYETMGKLGDTAPSSGLKSTKD